MTCAKAMHPLRLCPYSQQCARYISALTASNVCTTSVSLLPAIHLVGQCPYGQQCIHVIRALMTGNALTTSVPIWPAIQRLCLHTYRQQCIRSVCAFTAGNALTMSVPIWPAIHPLCLCTYGQQCSRRRHASTASNAPSGSVPFRPAMHPLHLCTYGQHCIHYICALTASNVSTASGLIISHLYLVFKTAWGFRRRIVCSYQSVIGFCEFEAILMTNVSIFFVVDADGVLAFQDPPSAMETSSAMVSCVLSMPAVRIIYTLWIAYVSHLIDISSVPHAFEKLVQTNVCCCCVF